jgi:signal transduction histidine kinase/CheY-like chemotaxis protein
MTMKKYFSPLLRAAVLATAAGSLLLTKTDWSARMTLTENIAELVLVLLAFLWTPKAHWSWKLAAAGLCAGDWLYSIQHLLHFPDEWLFLAEGLVFNLYIACLGICLARAYASAGKSVAGEKWFLAATSCVCIFITAEYVLLPFFQSGNHVGMPSYVMATTFRMAESCVMALAFLMSLKAYSAYWFCMTQGILLLSVASVALGYNEGVLMGQSPTFHEYGWLWGLLLLIFAQTWPQDDSARWSRWDGIRVRLVWLIFLFNVAVITLLFSLKILLIQDAYQVTSLLFIVYAMWLISNIIALQLALGVQKLLEQLRLDSGAVPSQSHFMPIYEIDEFASRLREAYAKIELQSAMAAVGQTAAMLAHDVRKPFAMLKSVLGNMDSMTKDRAALEKSRGAVEREMTQVDAMIADIMDYSRAVKLETKPENLTIMLDSAIARIAGTRPQPGILLRFELRHSRKPLADAPRLGRVISNILDNAVEAITVIGKKTSGGITIKSRDAAADEGAFVKIAISNTGPAIAEEDLPRMFETLFTRGKRGGTGLGLASAKKIMALHGGDISVRNLPGDAGVEFVLRLPASGEPEHNCATPPGTLAAPSTGSKPSENPTAAGIIVLACDDDELSRRCTAMELKNLGTGTETHIFPGAEELLAFLRADTTKRPDARYAVFTDQNMGGMSGLELVATLRREKLPCKVFMVSNEPKSDFAPKALAAGADDYFKGPLDADIVKKALK